MSSSTNSQHPISLQKRRHERGLLVTAGSICGQCCNLRLENISSLPLEWDPIPEPWIGSVDMQRDAAQAPLREGTLTWTSIGKWCRRTLKKHCNTCKLFDSFADRRHKTYNVLIRLQLRIEGTWMGPTQKLWRLALSPHVPEQLRPLNFWPYHEYLICMIRSDETKAEKPASGYNLSMEADMTAARACLETCRLLHDSCRIDAKPIPGMLVIDCDVMKVVTPPADCKYAALSYRWGKQTRLAMLSAAHQHYPRTIIDAASVCLKLGLRYLWVDRHCIIEKNDAHKAQQIESMHLIYRQAEVTIIARAGSGPDYGLPGVGTRPRIYSPVINIGNVELFRDLSRDSYPESEWRKRAWTLQEGYLSRRRLAFTDYQFVFECAQCVFAESDVLEGDRPTTKRFNGDYILNSSDSQEENLIRYEELVEQYTNRNLTREADSLNAFSGISQSFSTLPEPIHAVWGLPFIADLEQDPETGLRTVDFTLTHALCWIYRTRQHAKPVERRASFPSWSWCGWSGHYKPPDERMNSSTLHSKLEIVFEYEDIDPLTTAQLVPLIKRHPSVYDRPRAIRLGAFALPLACLSSWSQYPQGRYAADEGLLPNIDRTFYSLDDNIGVDVTTLVGRVRYMKSPANPFRKRHRRLVMLCSDFRKIYGIVLQRYGSTAPFERIGHFEICDFRINDPEKLLDEVIEKTGSKFTWSVIV